MTIPPLLKTISPPSDQHRSDQIAMRRIKIVPGKEESDCLNWYPKALGRQLTFEEKDVEELVQDVGSQEKESSVAHPESLTSHCPLCDEDTSISNSLCAFPSTYVDKPSWDLDRTNIWVGYLHWLWREKTMRFSQPFFRCNGTSANLVFGF
ncbi:hypothetical protein OPV22_005966 [Ensete ventricosum]|uniref:Uncharacterized protein n=1 Tax=Ensete ventricosum TaxID=4639 RepID=A0AAV8RSI3_ENSVE|nr:hypothetical protein OPV22_005966 [Ensete ventricosum]